MTKQHPLCLSVARSDEIECETRDNVGIHIKSPAFLPCKDWSFPEVRLKEPKINKWFSRMHFECLKQKTRKGTSLVLLMKV